MKWVLRFLEAWMVVTILILTGFLIYGMLWVIAVLGRLG